MQLNEKLYFNEDILTLEGELYVESVLIRDSKVFGEKKDHYAYGTQTYSEIEEKLEKALNENAQILVHCNGNAACQQYEYIKS